MGMLRSTLKNLFSRPYTTRYPAVPADLPPGNRGSVEWDMSECIFCFLCQKNCPTKAITTDKNAQTQSVVRNRCIACSRCVDVCPKHCIYMREAYSKPGELPEIHVYRMGMEKFAYEVKSLEIKRYKSKHE
jgi:ech hydrogenase subunit F